MRYYTISYACFNVQYHGIGAGFFLEEVTAKSLEWFGAYLSSLLFCG